MSTRLYLTPGATFSNDELSLYNHNRRWAEACQLVDRTEFDVEPMLIRADQAMIHVVPDNQKDVLDSVDPATLEPAYDGTLLVVRPHGNTKPVIHIQVENALSMSQALYEVYLHHLGLKREDKKYQTLLRRFRKGAGFSYP